jgi:dienelactone hydrolase
MRIEDIEYSVGGTRMVGHLAIDDALSGARPGVLVCHEGPGLDELARGRAERLAGLGYAAVALDYHGEGKPLERDEMMGRLGALMGDPDKIRELAGAGLAILLAQDQVDPPVPVRSKPGSLSVSVPTIPWCRPSSGPRSSRRCGTPMSTGA